MISVVFQLRFNKLKTQAKAEFLLRQPTDHEIVAIKLYIINQFAIDFNNKIRFFIV